MKYLGACGLLLLALTPAVAADAAGPTLKEARQRWLRGNYEEARGKYQVLLKDAKTAVAAALGVSQTWQSEGEYEKARAAIDTALRSSPKNADLLARQAELFYLRGQWDEAEKSAAAALKATPDHFLARWVRAQIYRDRGDLKKADAEFRWFVRTYSERSENDKDIKDPDQLVIVALAAVENARWHSLSDQFDFILKEVYNDAVKYDKDFWWAEYHAGVLLLEKFNTPEALEAFGKAETINASAAEVLVGRGQAALQKLDLTEAESFARRALRINPRLPEALRLRADVYLAGGDLKKAMTHLEKARTVNPRDEATLARVAACHALQGNKDAFAALVKEVDKYNSRPGVFYAQLAEQLEERRRYDEAEKYFKKAMALRPMLAQPQASLGMLYMRMGREEDARTVLTKALAADEFNLRVSNTLKVLKHLDGYDKIKTEHFLIRFDPDHDKVLARFVARYLEDIYLKLAEQFDYRPRGPILIELFNKHEMFSGRIIAVPDLHTIGACTGRMFAMVSPRDKSRVVRKPFNWARVLRHELVHIFNLEQTNFLVPHWFTEGLAVLNEGFPRPPEWNRLLVRRVPDKLLNLSNINMGFMRPRSREEWNLAYLQSLLYVQYMKEKYGPRTVGELLAAYRAGLDTSAAIKKACKVDRAEFEKGYRTYLLGVVKTVTGKPPVKVLSFDELEKAHKSKPDDPDIAAQLAEKFLDMGEKKDALKLARKVLEKKKAHPLASYVQARLLLDGGEEEKAVSVLEAAVDRDNPQLKVLHLLGKLYAEGKKFQKAAELFELAHKADPYETKWLTELARVYAQSKNFDRLIDVLKELAPTDADDLSVRKRLAELLLKAGKFSQAERYARQALEIDVLDKDAQKSLREALRKQNKDDALKELDGLLEK
jgi:tetratricopeptide (TPR) repeat protein